MRVNTKIVIDLISGEILERESHEWHGPVALAGKKDADDTYTVTSSEPPPYVLPYIEQQLRDADAYFANLLFDPEGRSPASATLAPLSPYTLRAIDEMRANNIGRSALGQLDRTLTGHYAPGGEGYNTAVSNAQALAAERLNEIFGSQRGSPTLDAELDRVISDAFALRSPSEITNQARAAAMAPAILPMNYEPLLHAGGILEGQRQSEIDAPYSILSDWSSVIAPYLGVGGVDYSSQRPDSISPAQTALGAAATGAGIYNMVSPSVWGGGLGPQYTGTGFEGLLSSGSF